MEFLQFPGWTCSLFLTSCFGRSNVDTTHSREFIKISKCCFILWRLLAILIIFVCAVVLMNFVEMGDERYGNYCWAFMITLCQCVGIYAHYDAKRGFIRFYVGFLLFYGINFNASYQSFLLSVLTTPTYAHQIDSIHDAIEHKVDNFTGGENLRALFEKNDTVSQHLHKVYDPCFVMDKCLENIKDSDKLAVAISRQHAKNAKISLTEDDMFCFEKANNICEFFAFCFELLLSCYNKSHSHCSQLLGCDAVQTRSSSLAQL